MTDDSLARRIEAVDAFTSINARLVRVGDIQWDAAETDQRLLATNYILRRQLEGLDASVQLARTGLGHLAVGFVRPALDELLWMSFLKTLDAEVSQRLFNIMGKFDARRSLVAQRNHVGDEVMQHLWYTVPFLDAQQAALAETKTELKEAGKELGWNGQLPSAGWIAEQVGQSNLYEYLHSATSRAIHFSAGEILRRGWGMPGGIITTKKDEFRDHCTAFALYQLPVLFGLTLGETEPFLEDAGVSLDDDLESDELAQIHATLSGLGKVPLVHAHEWNLTPEGPIPTNVTRRSEAPSR
jgi:hypothetical protein